MRAAQRYLLDTNIVSETRKSRMDGNVQSFLMQAEPNTLFISVLTLGELRKGVEIKRKSDPTSADLLSAWVDGLEQNFADRIIPIDAPVARLWGELSADRSRAVIDTLIAATALTHDLTLVTRNGKDVKDIDVALLDPFSPSAERPPR